MTLSHPLAGACAMANGCWAYSKVIDEGHLSLPWPPSCNRYWRRYGARMVMSKEARAYREYVGRLCQMMRIKPRSGVLSMSIRLWPPDKRLRDGHNHHKVLLDALQGAIFINDAQVTELSLEFHPEAPVKGGQCKIHWQFKESNAEQER